MKSLISILLLFLIVGSVDASPRIEDGTILYVWNGNRIVQGYTDSKVTHVGLIININEEPYLYEADVPAVRRIAFRDYLAEVAYLNDGKDPSDQMRVHLIQPSIPYTGAQIEAMKEYLDSKVGLRYSIRGYLHKRAVDSGMHCAELATSALNATGRYTFINPPAVSPKSLIYYMLKTYGESQRVTILVPAKNRSWREKQQHWWARVCTWCGWSCVESGRETLHWAVPSVEQVKME